MAMIPVSLELYSQRNEPLFHYQTLRLPSRDSTSWLQKSEGESLDLMGNMFIEIFPNRAICLIDSTDSISMIDSHCAD
jgi:hypothetical protein